MCVTFVTCEVRVCGLRCRSGSSLYIYRVYLLTATAQEVYTGTPTKQFSSGLAKRGFENPVPRTRNVRVIIVGPRKGRPAL